MALLGGAAAVSAQATRAPVENEVSTYIYGSGDGWGLPSQTTRHLAQKKEQQAQAEEVKAREEAAKLAEAIANARTAVVAAPVRETPLPAPADQSNWQLAQLALAALVGIGIAMAWNYFRQRRFTPVSSGPLILSVGGAQVAAVGNAPAPAPSPKQPPRSRGRRTFRSVGPRRPRVVERKRDPHNESIHKLAAWGILPSWVRDMSPVLTDGARLAGAISDDMQMYQMGGDAIPNYAYMLDPKGMAVSAARQREATAMVWSHQQWQA